MGANSVRAIGTLKPTDLSGGGYIGFAHGKSSSHHRHSEIPQTARLLGRV